ncbi:MAG: sensor histidine kinase, partial [Solimonas sp.]
MAGLTPQLLVIVAALLLTRILGWPVADEIERLGTLRVLRNTASGYFQLLILAAPMLLAIVVTRNLGPQRGAERIVSLAIVIVVSAFVGVVLRVLVTNGLFGMGPSLDDMASLLRSVWPRYVILGTLLTVALEFHRRELASIAATQQALVDHEALERQLAESRLQVLQAQIEPHFLFNTLANARRLYSTDPPAGALMLDNLMRYFDVALPRMRRSETTLGREAELARAYLEIHRIRMGRRLTFAIEMPGPLLARPVPPMMLLTLVENAIKHGLTPSPQGGAIRVTAEVLAGSLQLKVADSG